MPVTGTVMGVGSVTVTVQEADKPSTLAVIVALPADTAVTLPFWSTVATAWLLLSHTTV